MKKIIVLFVFLFVGPVQVGSAWSDWDVIDKLIVGSTGHLYVYTHQAGINPNACSIASRYILPNDHVVFERIYSAILSAFYAGKELQFSILDNVCLGGSNPQIHNIQVRKGATVN